MQGTGEEALWSDLSSISWKTGLESTAVRCAERFVAFWLCGKWNEVCRL